MKRKVMLLSIGFTVFMAAQTTLQAAPAIKEPVRISKNRSADWMKSPTGTWPGMKDGKTYWYKLDGKAKLWWSTDGMKWAAVSGGAWADSDGKWLKIHDKKLVWSTDGKSWSEVPEWKWKGSDGKWYKFDSQWTLWVNG